MFGGGKFFTAENHGVNGQCVQYGRYPLLDQVRVGSIQSRIKLAHAVVLWIGKNHIRGDLESKNGRSGQRAGNHLEEDVRQVIEAMAAAHLPIGCPVLLLGLYNPSDAKKITEMNKGLASELCGMSNLCKREAPEPTCARPTFACLSGSIPHCPKGCTVSEA